MVIPSLHEIDLLEEEARCTDPLPDSSSSDEEPMQHQNDDDEEYFDCTNEGEHFEFSYTENLDYDEHKILYDGCGISGFESNLMIMNFMIFWNLSLNCLSSLQELIQVHMKAGEKLDKSIHQLRNQFSKRVKFEKKTYCKKCKKILSELDVICCGEEHKSQFLFCPIEEQVKCLFERKSFKDMIFERFTRKKVNEENIESIFDGSVYKNICDFLKFKNHFSLCLYADGMKLFDSSKKSVWPIFLTFNELPYKARTKIENMILLGIWYDGKPDFNTFFLPAFESFEKLRRVGINIKNGMDLFNVKGVLLCGHGDAPAKAGMFKMNQFNGRFGCMLCYQTGRTVNQQLEEALAAENAANGNKKKATKRKRGNNYVYRYENKKMRLRTSEETIRYGEKATKQNTVIFGVQGVTIFCKVIPDFICGMGVDVMHCVFSGIGAKKMISLWFDKKFEKEKFSLYPYLKLVDNYLKEIKIPNFLSRSPKSINELITFSATVELKSWFFYFSIPVLAQIMKEDYFIHIFSLVEAVFILSQESISPSEIDDAEEKIIYFVSNFEKLYGLEHMNSNCHALLHLAENVRRLGPLYETTCFPKEYVNGQVKRMLQGTTYCEETISERMGAAKVLALYYENLPQDSIAKEFILKLSSQNKAQMLQSIDSRVSALGGKYRKISTISEKLDRAFIFGRRPLSNEKLSLFVRLQVDKTMYSSRLNSRPTKSMSYCVEYICREKREVGLIEYFVKVACCSCTNSSCICDAEYYAIIKMCKLSPVKYLKSNKFINSLSILNDCIAVEVHSLSTMCAYVEVDDMVYCSRKVNNVELE
jgi:hypothetical protein